MRSVVLCAFLLASAPGISATTTVRIQEIGLQGYYFPEPTPTRVQVQVTNSQFESQTIELVFRERDLDPGSDLRENQFTLSVTLRANEVRVVEVPLLFFEGRDPVLEVEARDTAGRVLARDERSLDPQEAYLTAIICATQDVCQAVQTQVSFTGTPREQAEKGKLLKFVAVRKPPEVWWAYAPARTVVFAAPARGFSPTQLAALEGYLRQGGRLFLIEDEVRDSAFLAPYRKGAPDGKPQVAGSGTLLRIHSVRGGQLGDLFDAQFWAHEVLPRVQTSELSWARLRLAASFRFPGFVWLLSGMCAYILIVGLLNFLILRRLGRQEWGWVTVPMLAVVFSVGLYVASAANRPGSFGLDAIAICWMDDKSPEAAVKHGIRVSSPRRAEVTVSVPGDVIFTGQAEGNRYLSDGEVTVRARQSKHGWNVRLAPQWQTQLPLRRWSFRDLEFSGLLRMSGTVRRLATMRLRNETGRNFRQAIYVDKEKVYFLGEVAPNTEVDLAAAKQEPLNNNTGRSTLSFFGYPSTFSKDPRAVEMLGRMNAAEEQRYKEEWQQLPYQPFDLVELIRGWPRDGGHIFDNRAGMFFGLSDQPVNGAELRRVSFARKTFAVTIVSIGREP